MSFRKPFRAPPLQPLSPYDRAQARRERTRFAAKVLAASAAGGLLIGAVSVPAVREQIAAAPVALGLARARVPQPGDYWAGCDDARKAGTAPIYAGEPGYREGMDGDGDGVACEPHPGS